MDHNLETPAMAASGVILNRGTPAERGTLNLATQALEFVLVSRNAVVTRPGFIVVSFDVLLPKEA